MPFVSGKKPAMNTFMTNTKTAKNMNRPYLKRQSKGRKISAMKKVKSMLTETVMLCPADRISKGKISLGTSQPSGPHEYANAFTNTHMKKTTRIAYHNGRGPGFPVVPNFRAIATAMTTLTE